MSFQPAWWLNNRHLQSIVPNRIRRLPKMDRTRTIVTTRDNDELLVDCMDNGHGPVVVLLHGLGGCSGSYYILGMQAALTKAGLNTWAWNARGALRPNLTQQTYHGGRYDDLEDLLAHIGDREVALVGFSLGAAMLVNMLGRNPTNPEIKAAVAISCPFEFVTNAKHLESPDAWFYRRYLLGRLRRMTQTKRALGQRQSKPWATLLPSDEELKQMRTFAQFDDRVTGPLNGFKDANDLYQQVDPNRVVGQISHPCLLLQASDDPMFARGIAPTHPLPKLVEYELTYGGGHVGFVSGRWPWQAEFYAERRAVDFILSQLESA